MNIFDKVRAKANVPKGYAEVKVEFTEEESEVIAASLDEYAAIANANAPAGTTMYVHPKVKDAMTAKALTEYVEDLMAQLQDCTSDEETASVMDKATQAQAKAYAIHNLPLYLFQMAGMLEFAGQTAKAKDFFRHFLRAQDEFKPDQVDTIFINETGFEMPHVIALAREKAR